MLEEKSSLKKKSNKISDAALYIACVRVFIIDLRNARRKHDLCYRGSIISRSSLESRRSGNDYMILCF